MNKEIANILINLKAVHISPNDFFTWTSGIKSPIYCDNRKIISFPDQRNFVVESFVNKIKEEYPEVELIAGTATAGIPWASFIAQSMDLPMVYIRSSIREHGLKSAIEGQTEPKQKVLLIEDLISTGKSSLQAADYIINADLQLLSVLSIFSYDLPIAKDNFLQHNVNYSSLCTLPKLLEFALESDYLNKDQVNTVLEWIKNVTLN